MASPLQKAGQFVCIGMILRVLELDIVSVGRQPECLSLQACSTHGRNSTLRAQHSGEGLVVCHQRELPSIQICMELLNSKYQRERFFLNLCVVTLAGRECCMKRKRSDVLVH